MRLPSTILLCLSVLIGSTTTCAAASGERYTLEAARQLISVTSPRVSPDGRLIAFLVTRPDFGDNRNVTELWVADAVQGDPKALTYGRRSVRSPQWSPDGTWLAFLAPDAKDLSQIWVLPMSAGEARAVTRSQTGVEHFAWRPDGHAFAYAAADTLPAKVGEARHIGTFHVGDQDLFLRHELASQHIWVQPLEGEARRITVGSWSLEFVLPPGSAPSRTTYRLPHTFTEGGTRVRSNRS